jgi:hypothetical protein
VPSQVVYLEGDSNFSATLRTELPTPKLKWERQVQIQTFVGNNSAKDLGPLISYISSQGRHEFGALVAALKEVDRLPDQKEKAIQLVKSLLPYKEALRNQAQQDSIIVFVYYALKQPSELSPEAKGKISSLVRQFDTTAQPDKFDSSTRPRFRGASQEQTFANLKSPSLE